MIIAFKQDMSMTIMNVENKFDTTITNIEKKFDNTIQQYERNAIAREERMNQQNLFNFRIAAKELLSDTIPVTPSETTQESAMVLHGGAK